MRARQYRSADRDACLAVFDTNVPRFFREHEREEFAAFLDALPGPYLVIEEERNGSIAACGGHALEPGTTTAIFCWGMVRRELHGRGLGQLLFDARLQSIRSDPRVNQVVLHTSQHTRGFYERGGFVTESVTPDGYAPGLDRCDMRLVL